MPTRSDLLTLPGSLMHWANQRFAPAVFADDARWNGFTATAGYTMRVFLSIGIALFLAFVFQLQSPLSAATTVLIVSNPTVGAMVSKSVWRLIGTLIGAAISVGLWLFLCSPPFSTLRSCPFLSALPVWSPRFCGFFVRMRRC